MTSMVALRPFAEMLVIDASDVRAADGRGLDSDQNFTMTRPRDGNGAKFHFVVSRQKCS